MATSRRRIDAASKLLFVGDVVADLIRLVLPALAAELDLDAAQPLPTEFVADDRSVRSGDAAWLFPFAGGGRSTALAPVEFQHRDDADMLDRMRDYTVRSLADARRRGAIGADEHPVLLPLVIYTGPGRWQAADGMEPMAGLSVDVAREVAPYQQQAYISVAAGGRAPLPAGPADNRFLAASRLIRCRGRDELLARLETEWMRFDGADGESFRIAMHGWAEEVMTGMEVPTLDEMNAARRSGMLHTMLEERGLRWQREWLEEGRQEGMVAGQRDLLVSMAERRFGSSAGERLADALDGKPSSELLSATGDLILACETTEEFVGRLPG